MKMLQKWIKNKACQWMWEGIEYNKPWKVYGALRLGMESNALYGTLLMERRRHEQIKDMTLMQRASRAGNLKALKVLVQFGAQEQWEGSMDNEAPTTDSVFSEGSGRWLALHHAVAKGHVPVVEFLTTQTNQGVNMPTQYGWTPLWIAIREQRYEVVQWLLEHGADANAKVFGRPILVGTAYKQDIKGLELLLSFGADPNAYDLKNATALHALAQVQASNELVLLLLEYGARLDMRCKYGKTPVGRAYSEQCYRLCSLMEQYALAHSLNIPGEQAEEQPEVKKEAQSAFKNMSEGKKVRRL